MSTRSAQAAVARAGQGAGWACRSRCPPVRP